MAVTINSYKATMKCEICGNIICVTANNLHDFIQLMKDFGMQGCLCEECNAQTSVAALLARCE